MLHVCGTMLVLFTADQRRQWLLMSSAKSAGSSPDNDWGTRHASLYFTSELSYQTYLYICLYPKRWHRQWKYSVRGVTWPPTFSSSVRKCYL